MSVLNKIIKLLNEKNISQKELTDFLGIDKSTFSQWKAGKNQSYTKYISQIADFLDTTPSYLWGWTDDPTDYEKTADNLNAPLEVIEHFNGNAEKIYNYEQSVKKDTEIEKKTDFINSATDDRIIVLLRHLEDIPKEDREQILKNFELTIDIYISAKGIKRKND